MKKRMIICVMGLVVWGAGMASADGFGGWGTKAQNCQIMDAPDLPQYEIAVGYIEDSEFGGGDSSSLLETGLNVGVGSLSDVMSSELDFRLVYEGTFFMESGRLHLPEQVVKLAAEVGLRWKFDHGLGLMLSLAPGFYSDMNEWSGRSMAFPFTIAGVKRFVPELSGKAGLEIRPGFEQVLMPVVGVVWQPHDQLRIQVALPESRISWWDGEWGVHVGYQWKNLTYHLAEEDNTSREEMTLEDFRFLGGLKFRLSGDMNLTIEAGKVFSRTVEFDDSDNNGSDEIDIENAITARVMLSAYI